MRVKWTIALTMFNFPGCVMCQFIFNGVEVKLAPNRSPHTVDRKYVIKRTIVEKGILHRKTKRGWDKERLGKRIVKTKRKKKAHLRTKQHDELHH